MDILCGRIDEEGYTCWLPLGHRCCCEAAGGIQMFNAARIAYIKKQRRFSSIMDDVLFLFMYTWDNKRKKD